MEGFTIFGVTTNCGGDTQVVLFCNSIQRKKPLIQDTYRAVAGRGLSPKFIQTSVTVFLQIKCKCIWLKSGD